MEITDAQECMKKDLKGLVIVPSYKGGIQLVGRVLVINKKGQATVRGSDSTVAIVPVKELSKYSVVRR